MTARRKRIWNPATLAAIMWSSACAQSAVENTDLSSLFSAIDEATEPGCAVGVYENGASLYVHGFGLADVENTRRLDGDTPFYAASNSKQFTALAVVMLVENGLVDLEDDIRKWVPEMPDYGAKITVRMMLNHTSGLPDFLSLYSAAGLEHVERLTAAAALEMILRQKALQFPPGSRYAYSNSGYFLLAEIVARASGVEFSTFIQDNIFLPLGMTKSKIMTSLDNPGPLAAHGYVGMDSGGFKSLDAYPHFGGSGGLMTTINDLQKFDHDFMIGHRVWTKSIRTMMERPGELSTGEPVLASNAFYDDARYASGLIVGEWRGRRYVSHGGTNPGVISQYIRFPEIKLGAAIFCNRDDLSVNAYLERAIDTLRGDQFHEAFDLHPLVRERPQHRPGAPVSPAIRRELVGVYDAPAINASYSFANDGDGVAIEILSAGEFHDDALNSIHNVTRIGNDFLRADGGYEFVLKRNAAGALTGFVLYGPRIGPIDFRRRQSN